MRNAHAMAYDDARKVVLLFGGADDRRVLGDLWAWNGETWHCLSHGGPAPRTFPALAYQASERKLLLFGGNRVLFGMPSDTATFLDDMWAWDGAAWSRIRTTTPSARAEASVAYDSDRQRLVLFGGYRNEHGDRIRLGDTWEWDGSRWEQKSVEGPRARNGGAMTYDPDRKRVVLFGGSGNAGDTWEWDGETWTRITSGDAEPRFNPAMTYDTGRHRAIRFGGWTIEGRVGDTGSFDGVVWENIASDGPPARNHTAMAYDAERGVIVLFGGHDGDRVFGDTWLWNGQTWMLLDANPPRLRMDNGH